MPCTIDLLCANGVTCAIGESEMQLICDTVLAQEGVKRPCNLSLSIVSDGEMQSLNARWRAQDRATDVLSLECERPDDPSLGMGEPCELGDIVLAPAYIERQAKEYGTTAKDETCLLLVHGLLHLLGYDHVAEEEALVMESREDELVGLLATDGSLSGVEVTRHVGEVAT